MRGFVFIVFLWPLFGLSQLDSGSGNVTSYSGLVVDSATNEPISYAIIVYDGGKRALNANAQGQFSIYTKGEFVEVRSIGYKTARVRLSKELKVKLAAKDEELAELVILRGKETPREVLFKAFDRLKKNYGDQKTEYKAFYRHYCKEDSTYGRLIEAALSIYDPKGHHQIYNHPKNKIQVRVDEVRRSFDYTKNFDEHDPISIYSTLKYDLTSYSSIHIAVPEEHNYRFVDTTYYDGHWVYVIAYNYAFKKQGVHPLEFKNEGRIYVNTDDYAILKVEERQLAENKQIYQNHTYELEWEVNYAKVGGVYHLSYAKESGQNEDYLYNQNGILVSFKDHLFHVEIMVNGINDVKPESFKGDEPGRDELSEMDYHSGFWENFPVLKDSPLNQEIVKDLERTKSLEEQFGKEK